MPPLNFSVRLSSETATGGTTLSVNAHPDASVARLLKYVHWKMGAAGQSSDYMLCHSGHELTGGASVQDIQLGTQGPIRLELQRRNGKPGQLEERKGSIGNIASGIKEELTTMNLQININTFSVEKKLSKTERVSMECTIRELETIALKILTDYEFDESHKNMCGLKDGHSVEDLVMLYVKGREAPLYLNGSNRCDSRGDSTLSQLLGIDFAPSSSGFFNVMFKARHGERHAMDYQDEDRITIEFVSDATLATNEMSVTADTTVQQVKEFICSAYTHSLRLSPADVKLVYKGQLIHRLDLAGKPCHIMEYIKEPSTVVKLHVYINQEYTEPGPGFWSELFHSPDRFDFMNRRGARAPTRAPAPAPTQGAAPMPAPQRIPAPTSAPVAQPALSSSSTSASASVSAHVSAATRAPTLSASVPTQSPESSREQPESTEMAAESTSMRASDPSGAASNVRSQFVTEAGIPLESAQETYTRCTLLGQQVLVPTHELDPFNAQLTVDGHTLQVSSQDYIISNGRITLSPQLVARVESTLGIRLKPPESSPATTMGPAQGTDSAAQQNRIEAWSRLFSGLLLIAKTLYLIANYSVIPFFFVLELSTVLPTRYTAAIAVLILLRTVWSTRELWDMWISYFDLNSIDTHTYRRVKHHILDKRLTRLFYRDCLAHPMIIDIFMASNLREQRQRLLSYYTFEELNEQHGVQAWHHFLQGVSQGTIRKEPLDDYLISCLAIYENSREVMPQAYSESWKQLLKLGQNDVERVTPPQQLPRHRRVWRAIQNHIDVLRQSQVTIIVLEHVVPDPLQDNLLAALAKNLALFFLILLPPLKHRVDTIIEERKRSRENHQEQQQGQQRQEHQELLPERPGATGIATHELDE